MASPCPGGRLLRSRGVIRIGLRPHADESTAVVPAAIRRGPCGHHYIAGAAAELFWDSPIWPSPEIPRRVTSRYDIAAMGRMIVASADFWAVSGWVTGILGVLLAVLAWLRPRRVKRQLAWWFSTDEIVRDDFGGGITINVDGQVTSLLSQTRITLINRGGEALSGEDLLATAVSPAGWMTVSLRPATQILRHRFELGDLAYILPNGQIQGDTCRVSWQVLEAGDSFEIVLLHSGDAGVTPVLATHIMNGRMRNIQAEKDEVVTILTDALADGTRGGGLLSPTFPVRLAAETFKAIRSIRKVSR